MKTIGVLNQPRRNNSFKLINNRSPARRKWPRTMDGVKLISKIAKPPKAHPNKQALAIQSSLGALRFKME
jgi:hypothetical protein